MATTVGARDSATEPSSATAAPVPPDTKGSPLKTLNLSVSPAEPAKYQHAVAPDGYEGSIPWGLLAAAAKVESDLWVSDEMQVLLEGDDGPMAFVPLMPQFHALVASTVGVSPEEYVKCITHVKRNTALRVAMGELTQGAYFKYNHARQGDLTVGSTAPDVPLVHLKEPPASCAEQAKSATSLLKFLPTDGRPLVVMAGSYT